MERDLLIGFGVGSTDPLSPRYVEPPRYGTREWMRLHVGAGNAPVGVVRGLVIDRLHDGRLVKVVGGSAERPTVTFLTPEEQARAIWTVSRPARSSSNRAGLAIVGAEGRDGPTATTWIFGAILLGAAIAVKAAEKRLA